VITAMLAMIFLGRKQYRHHWTGIVLIVSGVFIVGVVAVKGSDSSSSTTGGSEFFGIILLLISQLFAGTMFIVEEKLLGDYLLDPFVVVGTEGMWGLVYYLGLLSPMQLLTCGYGGNPLSSLCNFGYLENSAYAFTQMSDKHVIWYQNAMIMVSIASFNAFGIATTKYASAAQRSTIDTSRTVIIWICSCLFLGEKFQPLAIPGFIMLVIGTLMYNEILVIPFFEFNMWTQKAIAARKKVSDGEDEH